MNPCKTFFFLIMLDSYSLLETERYHEILLVATVSDLSRFLCCLEFRKYFDQPGVSVTTMYYGRTCVR